MAATFSSRAAALLRRSPRLTAALWGRGGPPFGSRDEKAEAAKEVVRKLKVELMSSQRAHQPFDARSAVLANDILLTEVKHQMDRTSGFIPRFALLLVVCILCYRSRNRSKQLLAIEADGTEA